MNRDPKVLALSMLVAFLAFEGLGQVLLRVDWVRQRNHHFEARQSRARPTMEDSIVKWKVYGLKTLKEPVDVFLLGDSSLLSGVDPGVLDEATGLTSYNFGTHAYLTMPGFMSFLEFYSKRFGTPKVVVLYFAVSLFDKVDPALIWKKRVDQWLAPPDEGLASRRLVQWVRQELKGNLASEKGELMPRGFWPSDREAGATMLANRGFIIDPNEPKPEYFELEHVEFPEANRTALKKFMAYSEEKGFKLLLSLVPFPESLRGGPLARVCQSYMEDIAAMAQAHTNVRVMHPMVRFHPQDEFASISHFRKQSGVVANTRALAEVLKSWD